MQQRFNDTWLYHAPTKSWQQLLCHSSSICPEPRSSHTAVYSHGLNGFIVFGGMTIKDDSMVHLNDLWVLSRDTAVTTSADDNDDKISTAGTYTWKVIEIIDGLSPSPRDGCAGVILADQTTLLLTGGYGLVETEEDVCDGGNVACMINTISIDDDGIKPADMLVVDEDIEVEVMTSYLDDAFLLDLDALCCKEVDTDTLAGGSRGHRMVLIKDSILQFGGFNATDFLGCRVFEIDSKSVPDADV